MPHPNHPGNYMFNRPRPGPAGPAGYERGYYDDRNFYGQHHMPRPMSNGYRPNEPRGGRHNERLPREDDRGLGAAMSNLSLGGASRNRQPAHTRPRAQTAGLMHIPVQHNNFVQNVGQLPSPPMNWINQPEDGNNKHFRQMETTVQKQVRQVYQAKTQRPTHQE